MIAISPRVRTAVGVILTACAVTLAGCGPSPVTHTTTTTEERTITPPPPTTSTTTTTQQYRSP
jgi:hypothetical protein